VVGFLPLAAAWFIGDSVAARRRYVAGLAEARERIQPGLRRCRTRLRWPPWRRAQARVGAIVDEPRFHPYLTGRDNLRLLAAARGGDARQRIGPSQERVGLAERADDKVASFSMGMRQRLGVASCLIGSTSASPWTRFAPRRWRRPPGALAPAGCWPAGGEPSADRRCRPGP
jgi:hypothetical protein